MPSPGFDALDQSFSTIASHRVDFNRDESDSFSLSIESLRSTTSRKDLPKTDILPLLPSGSRWDRVRGWRSINGLPFRSEGVLRLALGMTTVKQHESRGSYPVARYYILDFRESPIAGALRNLLDQYDGEEVPDDNRRPAFGAILGSATTPSEHRGTECRILRRAIPAYDGQRKLLFRTAVLSREEVPSFSFLSLVRGRFSGDDPRFEYNRCLYSTIPTIYQDFSWTKKVKVMLELDLSTDVLSGE